MSCSSNNNNTLSKKRDTSSIEMDDDKNENNNLTSDELKLIEKLNKDLNNGITNNDLQQMTAILKIYDNLNEKYIHLVKALNYMYSFNSIVIKATNILNEWKLSLKIGDRFDYYDSVIDHKWWLSEIVNINEDGSYYCRFPPLADKWNQDLDTKIIDIVPPYTWSKINKWMKPILQKEEEEQKKMVQESSERDNEFNDDDLIINEKKLENITTTRFGRTARGAAIMPTKKRKLEKPIENIVLDDINDNEIDEQVEDNNDWICGICDQLEEPTGTELVLCDGACMQSFHYGCLANGLALKKKIEKQAKQGINIDWFCHDCINGEHECFVCKKYGKDDLEVCKCNKALCGKYYHHDCLTNSTTFAPPRMTYKFKEVEIKKVNNILSQNKKINKKDDSNIITDLNSSVFKKIEVFSFNCPHHYCDTCETDGKEILKKKPGKPTTQLFQCLFCPRAYHLKCIEPGYRTDLRYVICSDHPDKLLPGETKSDPFSKLFTQMNHWEEDPVENNILDSHFRIPIQFEEFVKSTYSQDFKIIQRNDYDPLGPKRDKCMPCHATDESCGCTGTECGSSCLNRILKIECCDSGDGGSKSSVCSIGGGHCGNRLFRDKTWAKTERFKEHAMGWGLRAKQEIKEGQLVIEYIGEVIDEIEMRRRMEHQRKFTPLDHEFYIMEIDNGFYVDGKKRGNVSRFINHSCDPNCELERWVVNGRMRIGIFAIKDIADGEPLSYDYQFDTKEADAFKCYCGSDTCRGTMAPRQKGEKTVLSKSEKNKLYELGKRRDKVKKLPEQLKLEELYRSQTSKFLPGDNIHEVRSGPLVCNSNKARENHIYLVRNSKYTQNWMERRGVIMLNSINAAENHEKLRNNRNNNNKN